MDHISINTMLISLLQEALDAETAFAAGLSAAERAAEGNYEQWTPRDLLAHNTAWKWNLSRNLQFALKDETPPAGENFETVNRRIYETHLGANLKEVLANDEKAVETLRRLIEQFPEKDLASPTRYPWRKGRPLYSLILTEGHSHPLTHLAEHALIHNNPEFANHFREQVTTAISSFEDSPEAPGIVAYNLACVYVTSGQHKKAIEMLVKALQLNPNLRNWAREDPDLTSLHNDLAFKALLV